MAGPSVALCRIICPCAAPYIPLQSSHGAPHGLRKGLISLHIALHSLREGTVSLCGLLRHCFKAFCEPSGVRVSVCPAGFTQMLCSRVPQWATTVLGCLCAHLRARLRLGGIDFTGPRGGPRGLILTKNIGIQICPLVFSLLFPQEIYTYIPKLAWSGGQGVQVGERGRAGGRRGQRRTDGDGGPPRGVRATEGD